MGLPAGKVFVDILGEIRLRSFVGEEAPLTPTQAAVLARLVLARGSVVHERLLRDLLPQQGGDSAVEKHVSGVRALLRPMGVTVPDKRPGGYLVLVDGMVVDAYEFQGQLAELSGEYTAQRAAELLAMWRNDPRSLYPRLPAPAWREVFQARDELLAMIAREATVPPGWARFAELFPDDPAVQDVAKLLRDAPAGAKTSAAERLLIVEDRIGDRLCSRLTPYECLLVRSLAEWRRLLREKGRNLDFDAAIVDLHLTEHDDDCGGLDVLEYLRDNHPEIPAILLTAHIKPGIVEDMKEKYRIALIIHKDESGSIADIRNAVTRVLRQR
jgi:CheY-like chemotaxis protein